jgi:transposase
LNANSTIQFFQRIEQAYPEKSRIHVFCDNARYYKNKQVQKYLKVSKVELHYLPPYSPNLNPIERLWKWMKEVVIYNAYYPSFESFTSAIFGFFKLLSRLSPTSELGKCFRRRVRDKFRPIGAPATNF